MTSKWIQEAEDKTIFSPSWGEAWIELVPVLERIDALLKRAMISVDSESLYDEIMKEVENV